MNEIANPTTAFKADLRGALATHTPPRTINQDTGKLDAAVPMTNGCTSTSATIPADDLASTFLTPRIINGAGYVDYLQSPREDEWVLLHEQQAWGAWRNDATGHSWD